MTLDIMPWLVVWGIVTVITISLAVYRWRMDREESLDIHLGSMSPKEGEDIVRLDKAIRRVELVGKSLTVVSVVLGVSVLAMWTYNQVMLSHLP
jgi:hypothetical protein